MGKYTERYIDSSNENYGLKNCCPIKEVMCVDQSMQKEIGYNGLKGSGYKEKILREYRVFIKQEQPLMKQWEIIAKKVGKASIKECQFTAHLFI